MERVLIFDTTLRDGEQSPGSSMTPREKLRVARALDSLEVDIIEAGFPMSSPHEREAVRMIASELRRPCVAALARAVDSDIDSAAAALEGARNPRIHTFIATSDLHLEKKLRISRQQCLDRVARAVERARKQVDDVEFSAEDATRTDSEFLAEVVRVAIEAGATTINLPDTVGYALPSDIRAMVQGVRESVPGIEGVVLSTHCHDDLGLAVANSLAAVEAGARQVECTINGIGERAGNAALEEVVMALHLRPEFAGARTGIETHRLCPTSELLGHVTGLRPQPNKAIVGSNAFAHEAGIHQDGMLKHRQTYEIMTPELVGARESRLVLGKHSGRHAVAQRLEQLGFTPGPEEIDRAYHLFILLTQTKKEVHDEDLLAIYYEGTMADAPRVFELDHLEVRCGRSPSRAEVRVSHASRGPRTAEAEGDGPIDATFTALAKLSPRAARLEDFRIRAASEGTDAVGEAHLVLNIEGRRFHGRAASTDIVDAAARAYLQALDKAEYARTLEARSFERVQYWGV